MKKKVLILSALLTVVLGAVSLQSCSSDDNYTTEEYGYYTEEEIDAIKALGEQYGISVNIDETTYEVKKTLEEFEEDIKMHASLLGEYELVPVKNGKKGEFMARKKGDDMARTVTRAAESGTWGSSFSNGLYTYRITINWRFSSNQYEPGVANGEITASRGFTVYSGTLRCGMGTQGTDTVTFSGTIRVGYYTYYVTQGQFSISTNAGSYFFENTLYQEPPTVTPKPELKPTQE